MVASSAIRVDNSRAVAMLSRIEKALGPEGLRTTLDVIGAMSMSHIMRRHRRYSSGGGKWRKHGRIAALLRRGKRITTFADLDAQRAGQKVLRDTGRLLNSFAWRGPDAASRVEAARKPARVIVGTTVSYARKHHTGGTWSFAFDEAHFDRRVAKTQPGAKVSKRARKNWNRDYFVMRGMMRKLSGQSMALPRRPLVERPTGGELKQYASIVQKKIREAKGGGRG